MPPFITSALESFLQGQGASLIKSGIASAITALALHLHLNGFVPPTSAQAWSATITASIVSVTVHWLDHNFGNANVAVTAPVAPAAQIAAPSVPLAAAPVASPASSEAPSA